MTWQPGDPVHPRPMDRVRGGGDPEWQQPMITVRDDIHDADMEMLGLCAMCDDPEGIRSSGFVWSKLVKAAR